MQGAALQRQEALLAHEERRRSAAEARLGSLSEEEAARWQVASRERAELQAEVEALRSDRKAAGMQSEEQAKLQAAMSISEAERVKLRTELAAESSAVKRAYHQAEEQQWRHQASLEHAQQHASRCEAQVQELRTILRARDESFEERVAEAQRAAANREAAEVARAEAHLRAEVGAEREALYARVREQLVGLTSLRSSPSKLCDRGPRNMANQQVV
jgi:chromosome segregation ATPase